MQIEEAKKLLSELPNGANKRVTIQLGYLTLILPLKDANTFNNLMADAEKMAGTWDDKHIAPIESTDIEMHVMSEQEYQAYKLAQLLGITFKEARELQDQSLKKYHNKPQE